MSYIYPAREAVEQVGAIVADHGGHATEDDGGIEAFWRLPDGRTLALLEGNVPGVDVSILLRQEGATIATWEGSAVDAAQVARLFIVTAQAGPTPAHQMAQALR